MHKLITLFIMLCSLLMTPCFAESNTNEAINAFNALDAKFVKIYNAENVITGQNTYPLLLVTGFNYTLYTAPGKSQTLKGLVAPFNELKAVSHIGPALYAIGLDAWRDPKGKTWQTNLQQLQVAVQSALDHVDQIDWSNVSWPDQTDDLKKFMRASLEMVNRFANKVLKKGEFTLADYQTFSQHYMHSMLATMFLADLANTKTVLKQLNTWKAELGPKWDDLYVLIMGTKGRSTSELTIETNTAAITVGSLMKKDLVKTHIIIMPGATTLTQAQNTLGAIINTRTLGQQTFVTHRAKVATGIFKATQTYNVPLAKDNVQSIVTKEVQKQQLNLPQFNLLPKDQDYFQSLVK